MVNSRNLFTGHGGYSFVKKPLKTRTEKYEIKLK